MLWGDWLSGGKSPDAGSIARAALGLAYNLEKREAETSEVSKTSEVCWEAAHGKPP